MSLPLPNKAEIIAFESQVNQAISSFNNQSLFVNAHQTKFAEAVAQVVMDKENVNLSYAMQNPKLVERELTYEKAVNEQLKTKFIQTKSKAEFLKNMLEISPELRGEDEVEDMKTVNAEWHASLSEIQNTVDQRRSDIEMIAAEVFQAHEGLATAPAELHALIADLKAKTQMLEDIDAFQPSIAPAAFLELEAEVEIQKNHLQGLSSSATLMSENLADVKYQNSILKSEVLELRPKLDLVQEHQIKAEEIAKGIDSREEELAAWMKEARTLLEQVNDIKNLHFINDRSFEVTYDFGEDRHHVVKVVIIKDGKLTAEITPSIPVLLSSILAQVNSQKTSAAAQASLDDCMSLLLRSITKSVRSYYRVVDDISLLQTKYSIHHAHPDLEVVFPNNRSLMIRFNGNYPHLGGMEVIGLKDDELKKIGTVRTVDELCQSVMF